MNAHTLIPSSNDLFSIMLTEWSVILILSAPNAVGRLRVSDCGIVLCSESSLDTGGFATGRSCLYNYIHIIIIMIII